MRDNIEGLICPSCRGDKLPVDYTTRGQRCKQRIRVCAKCGRRLKTIEKILGT